MNSLRDSDTYSFHRWTISDALIIAGLGVGADYCFKLATYRSMDPKKNDDLRLKAKPGVDVERLGEDGRPTLRHKVLSSALITSASVVHVCLSEGLFDEELEHNTYAFVTLGLVLCTVADYLIESDFLAGLVIFLSAHLSFSWAFYWASPASINMFLFLGFTIIGLGIYALLLEEGRTITGLKLPVLAYTLAITTKAALASNWGIYAFIGAILFIISDAILAFKTFYVVRDKIWRHHMGWSLMVIYYAALAFISYEVTLS